MTWLLTLGIAAIAGLLIVLSFRGDVNTEDLLALIAGLVAQSVVLVGLLAKGALDQRNQELAEQAESRLVAESALKAVAGLEGEGPHLAQTRNGGTVLALVALGQTSLALALVDMLWPAGLLNREAAVQVVQAGLSDSDDELQATSAAILAANAADSFPRDATTYYMPKALNEGWNETLSRRARLSLLSYLFRVCEHLTSGDLPELEHKDLMARLNPVLRALVNLQASIDEEAIVVNTAATLLRAVLRPYLADPELLGLPGPGDEFSDPVVLAEGARARLSSSPDVIPELYEAACDIDSRLRRRFPEPYPPRRATRPPASPHA